MTHCFGCFFFNKVENNFNIVQINCKTQYRENQAQPKPVKPGLKPGQFNQKIPIHSCLIPPLPARFTPVAVCLQLQ